MALLSRESILGVVDVVTKDVDVPEWGGSLRVRTMTVSERNEFARVAEKVTSSSDLSIASWLVTLLAIDESGKPLFTAEDVKVLQSKNYRAVDKVLQTILLVNGMSDKAVEDAAKN